MEKFQAEVERERKYFHFQVLSNNMSTFRCCKHGLTGHRKEVSNRISR